MSRDVRPTVGPARPPALHQEPPTSRLSQAPLLPMAVWFGFITGLGEIGIWVSDTSLSFKKTHIGQDIIWMSPLANVIVFVFVALILSLARRWWPRLGSLTIAAGLFSLLTYVSLLSHIRSLHAAACWLLAAGLATQTARLIKKYPTPFEAMLSHTVGWLHMPRLIARTSNAPATGARTMPNRRQLVLSTGASLAGLALGVHTWQHVRERRVCARQPTPCLDSPNVLLIVLDTVRAASLGLYGYARNTTPNLSRLAESGVCFLRAISTAPWTLPSHATMFTGRSLHELSVHFETPLDETFPTLAEAYKVAALNGLNKLRHI